MHFIFAIGKHSPQIRNGNVEPLKLLLFLRILQRHVLDWLLVRVLDHLSDCASARYRLQVHVDLPVLNSHVIEESLVDRWSMG